MQLEKYVLTDAESMATPALVFYPDTIERNLDRMVSIAGDARRLWPHVKTHKSEDLVCLSQTRGVNRFKCATIAEGEMLGRAGAGSAIVAYPLVGPAIERYLRLRQAFPDTTFFAIGDDAGQIAHLSDAAVPSGMPADMLLDVNAGMNRTGASLDSAGELYRQVARLPGICVRGLHVYDGHHHSTDVAQRQKDADETAARVYRLRDDLQSVGLDCGLIVIGGTPTFPCYARHESFSLSPGTCLLHDAGYAANLPDLPFDIGALLLTRVVSHPAPGLFTVDLGYKAVAADPPVPRAIILGYEKATTVIQSEEHWVLAMPGGQSDQRPPIGQLLYAAPWHICPTSALYPSVWLARENRIVGEWPITARNRKLSI